MIGNSVQDMTVIRAEREPAAALLVTMTKLTVEIILPPAVQVKVLLVK